MGRGLRAAGACRSRRLVAGLALLRGLLAAAGLASMSAATAFATVEPAPAPELRLQWQPAPVTGRRPVVVALHGCSGLHTSRGVMDARYVEYAARWNAAGWHVLLPDSFGARGRTSTCREPSAERSVTVAMRRRDVNIALQWLMSQPDVDPRRVALVGWSNGGSTVLRTIHRPEWPLAPVAAIALYPSCAASLRNERYANAVPLLLLVGALDDWTPPQPCEDLVRRLASSTPAGRGPVRELRGQLPWLRQFDPGAHAQGHPQRRGWPQRSRRWQPCRTDRRPRTHRSVPQAAPRLACSTYTHCSSAAALFPPCGRGAQ